jgi:hypothetical protein
VFPLRLLQLHMVVLYYATARLKYVGAWVHGVAIYQVLQLDGFVRPLGAWIGGHPTLCMVGNYAILAMETAFPICALLPFAIRPARALALFCGVAVQVSIALTVRPGIFQEAMLSACALFVLPEWFDGAQAWLAKNGVPWAAPWAPGAGDALPPSTARLALWGVLAPLFLSSAWIFIGERRLRTPRPLAAMRKLLALEQPADLFGTIYGVPRWRAPGVLTTGEPVDVLAVVAPETEERHAGIRYSRWTKFTFKERDFPLPWATLGPYLCREYAERRPGTAPESFDVIDEGHPPRLPGGPPPVAGLRVLWHQRCD